MDSSESNSILYHSFRMKTLRRKSTECFPSVSSSREYPSNSFLCYSYTTVTIIIISLSVMIHPILSLNSSHHSLEAKFLEGYEIEPNNNTSIAAQNLLFSHPPHDFTHSVDNGASSDQTFPPEDEDEQDKFHTKSSSPAKEDSKTDQFPPFNGNVTPVFVISVQVCNAINATAYKLHASGQNLTYSIIEGKAFCENNIM